MTSIKIIILDHFNSTDNIKSSDLFNFNFPKVLGKNEFLSLMYNLRKSDKYIHISYKILKGEKGYVLNLNIKKSPIRLINKVIIKDNKKLSKSFIKEILNIRGDFKIKKEQKLMGFWNYKLYKNVSEGLLKCISLRNLSIGNSSDDFSRSIMYLKETLGTFVS